MFFNHEIIGKGSYGEVYKATHNFDKQVIFKINKRTMPLKKYICQ